MISHKYKCIFIHIPKCAGTSIENALGHHDNPEGRGEKDHRTIRMIEQPILTPRIFSSRENIHEALRRIRHIYASETNPRNKFTVTKEQYDSYFKFAIIRNPWSRAYSAYRNVMRSVIHRENLKITGELSLNEYLRRFAGKGLLRPQIHWIKDYSGSIPLDYIGRFETLDQDLIRICDVMNIAQTDFPHMLKGSRLGYRDQFDEDSIKLIADFYKEEIECFGYSFDS